MTQKITSDFDHSAYPRDLKGYADTPPKANWPGGARIAVQFVLNIEEGAENSIIHGDSESERFLSDILGTPSFNNRHQSIESAFEYGSRVGVWRVLDVFKEYGLPITTFTCAAAAEKTPHIIELASHGLRWITYQYIYREIEREHVRRATEIFERMLGKQPIGWYTGRDSPNTRELVVEQGGYSYDSDSYADELPYWLNVKCEDGDKILRKPHLVIPYTLETNDMRFSSSPGFTNAEPFYQYLKDSFDTLYEEGDKNGKNTPKMLTIGLHCRIIGRAGRIVALKKFLQYITNKPDVWVCRRDEIAKHWYDNHPATKDNTADWM